MLHHFPSGFIFPNFSIEMHEQLAFVTGEATGIFQAILLESQLQYSSSVYCFMTALFYNKFLNSFPQTIQVDLS